MQAAVEIDFQGMAADEVLRQSITKHITTLEDRFGEITWCRVAIKAPSEHHRKGGVYEIALHIILPHGRAVDIARTATVDERYADPAFAVNDAFRRALRRLGEQASRQQGKVKTHADQSVAAGLNGSGLGSLAPAEGREERPGEGLREGHHDGAQTSNAHQTGKLA